MIAVLATDFMLNCSDKHRLQSVQIDMSHDSPVRGNER
jgi:hypothetical protein